MNSVTFVCHNAYPIFDQKIVWCIGGMETRAALFAKGLAKSGRWRVRFVVSDFGQPDKTWHEGIEFNIYKPWHQKASENVNPRFAKRKFLPALNMDRRDLSLIWQIPILAVFRLLPALFHSIYWRARKSDVVCCFGNNGTSAQVIADCWRQGIKAVLCIASDDDLAPDYHPDDHALNDYSTPKWMAHYALENAEQVFVQTSSQLQILEERFGRRGALIRNPVQIAQEDPARWPERDKRDLILWIGRSDTFHKQPLLFLDLAKRCPDLPFLMIVNRTHAAVFDTLQTECPPNLTIIEWVAHGEIWSYYRRARVFVSTSAYEGFPNTFLQCAVTGVPVASLTVDPENILSQHGCGCCADSRLDTLERDVRSLWSDPALAEQYALTFHTYTLENDGFESQVAKFESLLQKVVSTPLKTPPPGWWRMPRRRFLRRKDI